MALEASSKREQSLDKHVADLQRLCGAFESSNGTQPQHAQPLEGYEAALRVVDNLRRELVPRAQEVDMLKSSNMVRSNCCSSSQCQSTAAHKVPRHQKMTCSSALNVYDSSFRHLLGTPLLLAAV
jgi:hypothetical protein